MESYNIDKENFDDSNRMNSIETFSGTLRTRFQNKLANRKTNEYDTPIFNLDSKNGAIGIRSHDDSIGEFSVNEKENLFSLKKMNINDTIHKRSTEFGETTNNSFTSKFSNKKTR